MRETVLKRNLTTYIGLAATLLLLGLFFYWDLSHALTVHAFSDTEPVQGTVRFEENEIEGGYTVPDSDTGIILYYQIFGNKENHEVYISNYSYSGNNPVVLHLPSFIRHGEEQDPYTVVGINGGVFKNFNYLTSVVFPANVEKTYQWIGAEAFMNSSISANGITFGSSLREIRDRAFYGCSQLSSVYIGPNVTTIGNGVFASCAQLTAITVDGGNRSYYGENGVLYSRDKTQLIQWPAGLTVGNSIDGNCTIGSLESPVRIICARAFEGCTLLYRINDIYSTVTTIGERAFYGCTGLTYAKIPGTVQTIEADAFANCGPGLVIECDKGSAAERYAMSHGIATSVTCTVNFYDGASLVKTEAVPLGGSASAPILNERAGYTLTWDKDYTNVQQNLNVYASWKQNFTVTFKDAYSGQVMQVTSYFGGSVTPPSWTREGYVLGWDTTAYTYVTKDLTVNAVWLVSMTGGTIEAEKPKLGDTRTINYITYQVTRITASDARVKAVNITKRTLTTLVIPDTITFGGVTFKVTNVGVNAFRDMPSLSRLEIGKHVMKINRAAFYNCPKLKTIVIHSKKLSNVSEKAFTKTHVNVRVNVPNAYISKYKRLLMDGGLSSYAKVF